MTRTAASVGKSAPPIIDRPSDARSLTLRKLCVKVASAVFRANDRMPIMGMQRHEKEQPMPFGKTAKIAVNAVAAAGV